MVACRLRPGCGPCRLCLGDETELFYQELRRLGHRRLHTFCSLEGRDVGVGCGPCRLGKDVSCSKSLFQSANGTRVFFGNGTRVFFGERNFTCGSDCLGCGVRRGSFFVSFGVRRGSFFVSFGVRRGSRCLGGGVQCDSRCMGLGELLLLVSCLLLRCRGGVRWSLACRGALHHSPCLAEHAGLEWTLSYIVAVLSVCTDHLRSTLVLRVVVCHQMLMCRSYVPERGGNVGASGAVACLDHWLRRPLS